jgi:hypothetical protein
VISPAETLGFLLQEDPRQDKTRQDKTRQDKTRQDKPKKLTSRKDTEQKRQENSINTLRSRHMTPRAKTADTAWQPKQIELTTPTPHTQPKLEYLPTNA